MGAAAGYNPSIYFSAQAHSPRTGRGVAGKGWVDLPAANYPENADRFAGPPNFFVYSSVPSGSKVFIFREAMNYAGCIVSHCFEDFQVFDTKTGKLLERGSGKLFGISGQSALFHDDNLYQIRDGKIKELDYQGKVSSMRQSLEANSALAEYCGPEIILVDEPPYGMRMFSTTTGKFIPINAPPYPKHQSEWVVLKDGILRFSRQLANGEPGSVEGTPWFELFSLDGNLIRHVDLPGFSNNVWYVGFIGKTEDGVLLQIEDKDFKLSVPSLQLSPFQVERAGTRLSGETGSFEVAPGGKRIIRMEGDKRISQMEEASRAHQFIITVFDTHTGRAVGRHIESVVIRKLPPVVPTQTVKE